MVLVKGKKKWLIFVFPELRHQKGCFGIIIESQVSYCNSIENVHTRHGNVFIVYVFPLYKESEKKMNAPGRLQVSGLYIVSSDSLERMKRKKEKRMIDQKCQVLRNEKNPTSSKNRFIDPHRCKTLRYLVTLFSSCLTLTICSALHLSVGCQAPPAELHLG